MVVYIIYTHKHLKVEILHILIVVCFLLYCCFQSSCAVWWHEEFSSPLVLHFRRSSLSLNMLLPLVVQEMVSFMMTSSLSIAFLFATSTVVKINGYKDISTMSCVHFLHTPACLEAGQYLLKSPSVASQQRLNFNSFTINNDNRTQAVAAACFNHLIAFRFLHEAH